ncbi:hypothetical protein INT48_003314 [Thamnidium elegans]|uniref:Uncharacterized protein n=1 Tax=Thamnidium elegans TaxID=101142 RepID=A0A8H7SK17_9FUNG|nr:hypothetical protein INT48_003314 [Thamnidium elegans]
MRFFIYFWLIRGRRNLCRVVDEFSNDIYNSVIEEDSDDLRAVLQQQLQLNALSKSLEQAHAVLGAQIKDLNKSNNRDPVLLELAIQDIKNITSKIENARHPYQHPPRQRG